MSRRIWNRDELLLAFNLYCKIPFGQIYRNNPQIISLAALLERTPSAVSWKLANFASLDGSLKDRNVRGASHGARADLEIWNEFHGNWDRLAFESERLLLKLTGDPPPEAYSVFPDGGSRLALVKLRVNQAFFRAAVLSAYDYSCCVSGVNVPSLLIASHITPWAHDSRNRTNPRNGLCLSAMHDRAFDCGLITVGPDYILRASSHLKKRPNQSIEAMLLKFEGRRIKLPQRFLPDKNFLLFHLKNIFQR